MVLVFSITNVSPTLAKVNEPATAFKIKQEDVVVELPCAMVIFREKLAHHERTEHPHIASNVTKMSKKHIFFWNACYELL